MIETPNPVPSILLLVGNWGCCITLAHLLSPYYHGIIGSKIESLDQKFDLCIISGDKLIGFEQHNLRRKEEDLPFMPFLLVIARDDLPQFAVISNLQSMRSC